MIEVELLENKERREEMIDRMANIILEVGVAYGKKFNELIECFGKEDFIECCKNYVSNNAEISYVYFIYNNLTKLTKIGVTDDIKKRCIKINSEYRNTLGIEPNMKLIALIPCYKKSKYLSEKFVHNVFKDDRKFGEWFNIEYDEGFYGFISPVEIINKVIIGDSYLLSNIDDIFKYSEVKTFNYGDIKLSETIDNKIKRLAEELYTKILNMDILYVAEAYPRNKIHVEVLNKILNEKLTYIHKTSLSNRINIENILSCVDYLSPKNKWN